MNFFKRIQLPSKTEGVLKKLKEKFQKKNIDSQTQSTSNLSMDNSNSISKNGDELWRVGIICKKDCYFLTQEILKCLEKNGYEWKIISSSYKIKCRKKRDENDQQLQSGNLNVLIQIFSVSFFSNFS